MGRERKSAELALAACWQCQARLRHDQLICARCGATRPTAQMRAIAAKNPPGQPFRGETDSWREDTRARSQVYVPGGAPPEDHAFPPAWGSQQPVSDPLPWQPSAPVVSIMARPAPDAPMRAHTQVSESSRVPPWLSSLARAFFHETAEVWRATGFALLGALVGGGLWLTVAFAFHYESGFLAAALGALVGEGVTLGVTVRRHRYTFYALGLVFFCWALCIRILAAHHLIWSPLDGAYVFFALIASASPVARLPMRSFHRRTKGRSHVM